MMFKFCEHRRIYSLRSLAQMSLQDTNGVASGHRLCVVADVEATVEASTKDLVGRIYGCRA